MNRTKQNIGSYNIYFLIATAVWAIVGGVMLLTFTRRELFSAVNLHHSEALDSVMHALTNLGEGWPIILLLLLPLALKRFRNWWYPLAAIACNVIPALVIQLLKNFFHAARPFEFYKDDNGWIHFSKSWGEPLLQNSFPSGHSAGAFSLFCFLALLLPRKYKPAGLLLFIVALTVCYTRLYLAAHFFADVYAGSLIGCSVTVVMFAFMRRLLPRFYGDNEANMSVGEA